MSSNSIISSPLLPFLIKFYGRKLSKYALYASNLRDQNHSNSHIEVFVILQQTSITLISLSGRDEVDAIRGPWLVGVVLQILHVINSVGQKEQCRKDRPISLVVYCFLFTCKLTANPLEGVNSTNGCGCSLSIGMNVF